MMHYILMIFPIRKEPRILKSDVERNKMPASSFPKIVTFWILIY